MTQLAEPTFLHAPTPLNITVAPVRRQVRLILDGCCELAPATADQLGITLLAREAQIDGRSVTLNNQLTLHHSCWPTPPRRVARLPYTLGDLAQAYQATLAEGMSVLALHRPSACDAATRVALAARTITLAGRRSQDDGLRIAVYELTHIGAGFAFLVETAARAAAEGLPLHQLLTLLDRTQATIHSFYLTGTRGPAEALRQPGRAAGVSPFGNEQLWELDSSSGLFACRARSWNLGKTFASGQNPLGFAEPTVVQAQSPALLKRLNAQRSTLQQPAFDAQPGGASLLPLFPHGCVELVQLPDQSQIDQLIDVIRRIDRTKPQALATRRRGAIL